VKISLFAHSVKFIAIEKIREKKLKRL